MKKLTKFFFCLLIAVSACFTIIHAQDNSYEVIVIDNGNDSVFPFESYDEAALFYQQHFGDGTNILIKREGKIIQAKYALVRFSSDSSCSINTDFVNDANDENGYLNGCYGTDGAYLGINSTQTYAKFMISGVIGWVSLENAEIVLIEDVNTVSSYVAEDGKLKHRIKASFDNDAYSTVLTLDESPAFLLEDTVYYSYDGHYFYDDIRAMLDNYRDGIRSDAVNYLDPYYNYYMMVSNRTMTRYTSEEIRTYLQDLKQIDSPISGFTDNTGNAVHDVLNQSMMYGIEDGLLFYQNVYGANALMMLALSMNESAAGRSNLAFTRNNLFGHAAYDSDVEKYASRYLSVMASIASHAKNYISLNYSTPGKFMYHGSYFGNKESGMNVSYASDPYWGEKAASYYKRIDDALGQKDLNAYAIGIKSSASKIDIFREPDSESEVLATLFENGNSAFVLLEKAVGNDEKEYYKIQTDFSTDENGFYRYDENIGYIRASLIDTVLNADKIGMTSMIQVTADANGGSFSQGMSEITFDCLDALHISADIPFKDGYEFIGWEEETVEDTIRLSAQYKEIKSIEPVAMFKNTYTVKDRIDLTGGILRVNYSDGSYKEIAVDTSMVSGYDLSTAGIQDVLISYCGFSAKVQIEVKEAEQWDGNALLEMIEAIDEETSLEQLVSIKETMLQHPFYFTFDQRRSVDQALQSACEKLNVRVAENDLGLQLSGLALNVECEKITNRFFKVPLDVSVKEVGGQEQLRLNQISEANDYISVKSFSLTAEYQSDEVAITIPLIVTIDKNDEDQTHQYSVLHLHDGNVEIVYSKQSDSKITFEMTEWGDYLLVYKETLNEITAEDPVENNYHIEQQLPDMQLFMITVVLLILLLIVIVLKIHNSAQKGKRRKRDIKR